MDEDRERRIRERAYAIWQSEGCPEGRHEEHWRQARKQIEREDGASFKEAPMPYPTPSNPAGDPW